MNIVILDAQTLTEDDIDFSIFDKFGKVTIYDYTDYEDIPKRIKEAEVVLCNKSLLDKHNLEQAERVKYIGLFATGYNNVDLEYTKERGIVVCNAGSYSTCAVAQHVFAFIFEHYNKIAKYNEFVKERGWINSKKFSPFMTMHEIEGRTIGIVGYGSIGKKVAEVANAFGMQVLAYNRSKKEDANVEFVTLDELLEKSDIVTIHCPLNSQSEHMCNKAFFNKMKPSSYFINTSRGGVVDEAALVDAIKSKTIEGAALDVISVEPMTETSPLIGVQNLTITPHAAWAPIETRKRLVKIVKNNIEKWLAGSPVNVIE